MKRSRASAVVLAASSLFAASLVPVVAAPPALAANVITSNTVVVAGAAADAGLAIQISGAGFRSGLVRSDFIVGMTGTTGLTYDTAVRVNSSTVQIYFATGGVANGSTSITVQALSSAYSSGGGDSNTLTIPISASAPSPATITSGSSLMIGSSNPVLNIDLTNTQYGFPGVVWDDTSYVVNVGTTGLTLAFSNRDSSNPMRAQLTFSGTVAAGTLTVAVDDTALNPSSGGRTNTLSFTATSTPTPTVSGVSPNSGPANGTTSVTLTGTGFTGASAVTFGGTAATSVTVVNDTTITATTPSLGAGAVDVAVTTAGGTGTLNSGFTYTSSPTPVPVPDPPSAPRDVTAEGADASARVEWSPPASQGSFAISHYQVRALPGGSLCLVPSTQTTCVVKGLRNGTTYSVQVSALTGAGWGTWSDAVIVTPKADPKKAIIISGSRDQGGKAVVVRGNSEGLDGQTLQSWLRIAGAPSFSKGSTREVASDGTFTWSRTTGKRLSVYFATLDGSVKSNSVTVPAL